jgi:hypothetical protein
MTDQVSNPNGVAPVVPVQADPLATRTSRPACTSTRTR